MAKVPTEGETEPATITGGSFEVEYEADAEAAGEFLIELGEQLRDTDELLVVGDDWEIPFAFEEQVELEIEFEGDEEPELEIEIELEGRVEDDEATGQESGEVESGDGNGGDVGDEDEDDEE